MTLSQPPLTKPVLQLLQNQLSSLILSAIPVATDQSLTEQYLLSRLGLKLTMDTELNPDLQRYQQHFVLYHLLYRLQTEWLITGEGFLSIGLAKVTLLTTDSPASHELAEQNDNSSRREYYTNWQNFYAMSEQLLDDYLQQFWQRYSKGEVNTALLSAEQAQQCLQLNPCFTLTELKKAYRRQALLLHPDRASGDAKKFRQIQQAYQQLLKACR
ncbi:DNA-J related domain-containing protein [Arsukibacterium sp. MJ3]|uniref:DNA-J related domain-containing protein n=1 Tax=Arsukibacterium sp. MJ3 TaxID=1632859 RepID=UPI0009E2946F|nr:DNA-J related domain-containing protein [Arsukibacterium sp. MJ3]